MGGQLLTAGFYLVLAAIATATNRHRRTWALGAALALFSLMSSITFFLVDFDWKVVREIILATLLGVFAFEMWLSGDAERPNQTVMALCAVDLAFCGVMCAQAERHFYAQVVFAYGVNLIFAAMCIAVTASGVRDGLRRRSDPVHDSRPRHHPVAAFHRHRRRRS